MPTPTRGKRSDNVIPMKAPREQRYAACRSMGHEWHHGRALGIDDEARANIRRPFGYLTGMVGFPSTCTVCGMERVKWITRSGEVITRYEQPEGYARHGDERQSLAEWRSSFVSSVFSDFTIDAQA